MAAEQHEPYQKRVGQILQGKWQLERLIGVGGMAAVYAARHRVGTPVAIKILHPEVARSEQIRKRFEQEAMVMGKLEHPGAVEVRDIDVTKDGAPFLVMELLEGESLKDRLQRLGGIGVEEALRYADEALDVLAAAHDQGIVHRDIKLDNLFITAAGGLKVLDFGIARMREGAPLTMVGTRLGTLPYMPPEQVKGQDIDGRADLFAVGAVLFRILSRRRVHEADTESEMIVKMSAMPAPPLSSVAPSLPAAVCALIDRALAYHREKRYPDARGMQADVRALRAGQPPAVCAQLLTELGPPNDLVEPATRRPAASAAEPATSFTRVATPAARTGSPAAGGAVAGAGLAVAAAANVSPVSATAAASPFIVSPEGAPGAAGPLSATAQAPASMPKTALLPAQGPSTVEPTQLSVGVAHVAATAQGMGAAAAAPPSGPIEATMLSAAGGALGVASAVTQPGPVSLGAAPASLAVAIASEEERRRKRLAIGIMLAAGALALGLVLALWLVFSGDESDGESDEESRRGRSARAQPKDDEGDPGDALKGEQDAGAAGTRPNAKLPTRPPPATTAAIPLPILAKPTSAPPSTTQPPGTQPPGTQPPVGGPPSSKAGPGDDDDHGKGNKPKKDKKDKKH